MLPERLLSKGVEYHCRRGTRKGCECSYCAEKKASHHLFSAHRPPCYDTRYRWPYEWFYGYGSEYGWHIYQKNRRLQVKQKVRDKLASLKEEL